MKAIIFRKHGGPDVLHYTEVPEPRLHPADVLVRVRACALNHLDLWVRRGMPGVPIPLPHIPGSDIAGDVSRVGERVTRVKVGDKVVLAPGVSCGKCAHCLAGRDNRCHEFTNLGYMIDGGCAEFVRCPEVNCFPCPENLSFEQAAAIPYVFQTSWHMLVTRARLQPGETVLVIAGESGVGSAAVQIAKFLGAHVIASVGSEEKMTRARELGADDVIHHGVYKIDEEVKRLTNRRGVDIVFEHVGADTWEQSLASLARGGRLVTCGATSGNDAKLNLRYLFTRQISLLGSYMGTKSELDTILKLVAAGRLRPVIDRLLPLESCAEAHAILERRAQFGKIVLTV
jgi:NADPH:quinone reductase-like Zn-dependent oxidoreductase